jgi:hypothetical protein
LQWATAVAVFFLPKHWTLWVVDDMIAVSFFRLAMERGTVVKVGGCRVVLGMIVWRSSTIVKALR